MPSQSVERREPITGLIMIAMMITSIVGFMWLLSQIAVNPPEPRYKINKQINK